MARSKLKYQQKVVSRANNRFRKLLQKDIYKKGAIRTGTMLKSINPIFEIDDDEVFINLEAVYYYEYVDGGTRYIKAREFTQDVLESKAFERIVQDLMSDIVEFTVLTSARKIGYKVQ